MGGKQESTAGQLYILSPRSTIYVYHQNSRLFNVFKVSFYLWNLIFDTMSYYCSIRDYISYYVSRFFLGV